MKKFFTLALFFTLSHSLYASTLPKLNCLGTGPFWDIETDSAGNLSMHKPMPDRKTIYSKAVLKNAYGMSDNVYPYTALVDVNDGIYFGCCR